MRLDNKYIIFDLETNIIFVLVLLYSNQAFSPSALRHRAFQPILNYYIIYAMLNQLKNLYTILQIHSIMEVIQNIRLYFQAKLPELIQPYIQQYDSKYQDEILKLITSYTETSHYELTALTYKCVHGSDTNKEDQDQLMLLSYLVQFQVRLVIEQQQHTQQTLRKVIGDLYVYPLIQVLTQIVCQLTVKHPALYEYIQRYNKLAIESMYEWAKFTDKKEYVYNKIQDFLYYSEVVFHMIIACPKYVKLYDKVAEIIHIKQHFSMYDGIEILKKMYEENKELDAYQKILISKFDPVEIQNQMAQYNIVNKSLDQIPILIQELKDILMSMGEEWKWVLQVVE